MKLVYNWQILSKPIQKDRPLSDYIQVPVRRPINDLLLNESINMSMQVQSLQSPLVPIIFGYRIDEGTQYDIDIEAKIEKIALTTMEKRTEDGCYLYLLLKINDHQCYDTNLTLQIFIKYGLPQSKQLIHMVDTSQADKFIRMLSTRSTTLHSFFIYEKIKRDISIFEPIDVLYKLGDGYLLFSLTNKIEQIEGIVEEDHIIIQSLELLTWLSTGRHQTLVRPMPITESLQKFKLNPGQKYNIFFKIDLTGRDAQIPYILRWRWSYSPQVFGMLKYLVLDESSQPQIQ